MLRNTYEKGAAFAEGQSSNRSSTVREPQVCEKDEVDTAGEWRAHNQHYLVTWSKEDRKGEEGIGGDSQGRGVLRTKLYCEIRFEFCASEFPTWHALRQNPPTLISNNHYDRSC